MRWRDALIEGLLPGARVEAGFWRRFDAAAPAHLRLGLGLTSLVVGLAPLTMGHRRSFARLSEAEREQVLQRLAELPTAQLLEIAKVVACFAHFEAEAVQDAHRGRSVAGERR